MLVDANSYTYELMVGKDRNYFMKYACISDTIPNMTFIVGVALTCVKEITRENINSAYTRAPYCMKKMKHGDTPKKCCFKMLPFIIINEHFRTDTYRLFFIGGWGGGNDYFTVHWLETFRYLCIYYRNRSTWTRYSDITENT